MNKRTKFLLGIGVIATLVIGFQVAAFAIHETGAFELEGNAVDDTAVAGDDWENVCKQVTDLNDDVADPPNQIPDQCTSASGVSAENTAVSWVEELNTNASIFTGGGSKDPENITNWAWKDGAGGLPDKDNLQHSFAARYSLDSTGETTGTCPNHDTDQTKKCEVLFFGSDRIDNSGDAHQAFWFLQDEVSLGNVKTGGGFNFIGEHTLGDLLVISNFSNGGTTSTIFVYQWNPAVSGNLELLASGTNANCDDPSAAPTNDRFCGIVNPAETPLTDAPWNFLDKSGNTDYLNGEFFEGGVNLSALGLDDECFATAVAETRSSTSTTATLKDFVLGEFDSCEASVKTQTSTAGPVTPGTSVTDTMTITGGGVTDSPDPTGFVKFFLCGPIAANAQVQDCSTGGTQIGTPLDPGETVDTGTAGDSTSTATSDALPASLTATPGKYCFRAEYSGDTNYDAVTHTNSSTTPPDNECFTVQSTSSTTTSQNWIPNDTATITTSGSPAPALNGTVVFKLYDTAASCDADLGTAVGSNGLLYLETFSNVTSASGSSLSTNNDGDGTGTGDTINGYSVVNNSPNAETTTGPLYWKVTYTPAAGANHTGSVSDCVEQSSVTIDNDNTSAPTS